MIGPRSNGYLILRFFMNFTFYRNLLPIDNVTMVSDGGPALFASYGSSPIPSPSPSLDCLQSGTLLALGHLGRRIR